MTRTNKIIYLLLLLPFLGIGLSLNYILQKDFFLAVGFSPLFVVLSFIFLDGAKVIFEFLIMIIEGKAIRRFFAVIIALLIFASLYASFSTRQTKFYNSNRKVETTSQTVVDHNKKINTQKKLLLDQVTTINDQIKAKQKNIDDLRGKKRTVWQIARYNRQIDKLIEDKNKLILKISALESKLKLVEEKEVTASEAISRSFSISGESLETSINLGLAIIVEIVLLAVCIAIGKIIGKVSINAGEAFKENPQEETKIQVKGTEIKRIRKEELNLTQEEFAQLLSIPRGTLAKIETDKMEVTDDILEKVEGVKVLIKNGNGLISRN